MPERRILITGGTGFIGSHVVRRLSSPGEGTAAPALRLLTHRRTPVAGSPAASGAAAEFVRGDLCDPASLRGLCDGVDTVLHLAAHIGGNRERCRAVNDEGTGHLLAEAARAGVGRIVQLGTAAVYRDGPHRGEAEGELAVGPVSPTSVSRLAGEERVLAAGGTVLRPHLVYGEGDTWVVPALVDLVRRIPHWVDGGRALVSLVSADDLARVIAALALHPAPPTGGVLHASHPEPVPVRELVSVVARQLGLPLPQGKISAGRALELLGAGGDPVWARRLSLLTVDHWYDSSRLWQLTGCRPGPAFAEAFARCAPWYQTALNPL
ncbi:NAD(P)-dependent oxidoreductase [Streptomyces sp. NPDC051211]|uniref:NAD-dependent epimerase/dehydratase family protein n=1 Tax=Streptomyces sp. NPDC051211 TaxID=3154643 RepID=UPI00344D77D5